MSSGSHFGTKLRAVVASFMERKFRRRAIDVGHLLTGSLTAAVVGLGSMALTARGLGPAGYGVLALLINYAQAIERLVSFQSWQPIIRYGASLEDEAHRQDLMMLFKFGFLLDLASAFVAWLIAVLLAVVGSHLFGWDAHTLRLVLIYCTVLLFALSGMPTGILRLSGKFRSVAFAQAIASVVRLAACTTAFLLHADLLGFVVAWAATQVIGTLVQVIIAMRELHKRRLLGFLGVPVRGIRQKFPGIFKFAWSANLSLTLWSSAQQFDTLLVGVLTDAASAGFYNIAKRVGRLLLQVGNQVQTVVFPELAKLWADGEKREFRRLVYQVEGMLAVFGVCLVVGALLTANLLVRTLAGDQFAPAAPLLMVQVVAVVLAMNGSVVRSALIAMGKETRVLAVASMSTAVFYIAAPLLIPQIGPIGANVAHVLLGTVWIAGLGLFFRSAMSAAPAGAARLPSREPSKSQAEPAGGKPPAERRHTAFVINSLTAGGAERVVSLLANFWAEQGRRITVITFESPDMPPYYPLHPDIRLVALSLPPARVSGVPGIIQSAKRAMALRTAFRRLKPDTIISFLTKTNVLVLLAGLGSQRVTLVSERNNPIAQTYNLPWRIARAVLYRFADSIVMITAAAVEKYPKAMRARARVIPNPVKLPTSAPPRREGRSLTAVGRLVHQKGFDLLLEAFAPLTETFPEWSLSIWGEGPARAELEAQRDRLGLQDRVRFCGISARPGLWLESADAFVLSSRYEGWGNVIAEAMAAHVPVVSFDCDFGPSKLITNDVNGLLVANGDVAALRDALSRLMSDRELRERLACAGAQSVKAYAVENIAAEWDDAINAAIRRRSA